MARQPTNLHQRVREVLRHVTPLSLQADSPIRHFESSVNVGSSLLKYIDDHIDPADVYGAVYEGHLGHLRRMILAEMIESFEQYLKELAALCVDTLAPYATDDRFDDFLPKRGGTIAAFVHASSIGKALCESDTWLSNTSINDRIASLLKEPYGDNWQLLFPGPTRQPIGERERAATLAVLWQIRHNLAHNVGVLTHSDSMKFRLLSGLQVPTDCRLSPTTEDLRFTKRFLTETAVRTNDRVGNRLAELMTTFHLADPALFDAQATADLLSNRFKFPLAVDGCTGTP